MTKKQATRLMQFYAARIIAHFNHIPISSVANSFFRHLIGMPSYISEEFSDDKTMRWLGFMQGALWALHWYSLEELKEHSRRAAKDAYEPP